MNPINVDQLAADFADVLQSWLTLEEMNEVNRLNAAEQSPNICHSHDFCDANMAMLEAYNRQMNPDEVDTPETLTAWNAAWALAKQHEFNAAAILRNFTR